jgi:hypothetical protein
MCHELRKINPSPVEVAGSPRLAVTGFLTALSAYSARPPVAAYGRSGRWTASDQSASGCQMKKSDVLTSRNFACHDCGGGVDNDG